MAKLELHHRPRNNASAVHANFEGRLKSSGSNRGTDPISNRTERPRLAFADVGREVLRDHVQSKAARASANAASRTDQACQSSVYPIRRPRFVDERAGTRE
jgi:hypothetical protein